jgi:hypothetical protein
MTKIAIIVGGVVLMAGVALAGTLTSLGSSSTPAGQTIRPPAVTTNATLDDRGQENEARGRANEAGEDLRGPCDEAEHANDARCTGAAAPRADDNAEDVGDDHGGDHSNRGSGSGDDSSGHGGHSGDDD